MKRFVFIFKFMFKALLMFILPCYRVNCPTELMSDEFKYYKYDNSRQVGVKIIKKNSNDYVLLKAMLSEEVSGWRYDPIGYVPNNYYISRNMTINCSESNLVVSYSENGEGDLRIQISKTPKSHCPTVMDLSPVADH